MYYKIYLLLLIFTVFHEVSCSSSPDATETHIYRMPLMRRKSPLHMIYKDPKHAKTLKFLKTHPPTNENITLFKYLDSEYYAEILVGKPGQRFTVIFDTMWSDMWLPSKLCSKWLSPVCNTKNLYDGNASSTHIPVDPKPFEVDGLVGNLTCDTVRLNHLNVTNLTFAEIRIFPKMDQYIEYLVMHADGIIGLGKSSRAMTTNHTFFYKLIEDKKIKKNIFSVYINRDPTTPKGGTIFLGGIDPKHQKGEITYVPVKNKDFWQIEMTQFSVQLNKNDVKTFCQEPCQVILDIGSNKIGLPKEDVVAVNNLIGAQEYLYNRFIVPCTKVNKLPTITLSFGGTSFHIGGRHYIQKMENGTNGMICMSAFCETQSRPGIWTLGGAFLSSVYTIFDLDLNRVGFSKLNNNKTVR